MINIGDKVAFVGCGNDLNINPFDPKDWNCPNGLPNNPKATYVICGFYFRGCLGIQIIGFPIFDFMGTEVAWDIRAFRKLEELKMQSELEYLREQTQHVPTTGGMV